MSSTTVQLITGAQPAYFSFGAPGGSFIASENLLTQTFPPGSTIQPGSTVNIQPTLLKYTTTIQTSNPLTMNGLYHTFQLISSGAGTSTAQIQVSNEDLTGQGLFAQCGTTTSSTTVTIYPTTVANATGPSIGPFVQIVPGMLVVGPGIPAGTTVSSVTNSTTIVLSAAATLGLANVGLQFYNLNWFNLGSALTLAAAGTTGVADVSAWKYVRANVTAVSGTVQIILGV